MENREEQVPLLAAPNDSIIPDPDASVEERGEPLIREDTVLRGDSAFIKDIVQKIDLRILPLLFITFNFNFIDKTILSSASVFGLKKDTSLTGDQYAWVSSIFYFGYFIWEYPTTIFIQKLPVGKYVALNIMVWGMVVTATSECANYHQLLVARFFTGALEATISPAFLYITSMWYTRDEIPSRMAVWYAGNSFGGAVAGVLSYAIGHIEHPLSPWRWLYIIFGLATMLWGVIVFCTLPDSIETAEFLDEKERQCADDRVVFTGTGITMSIENHWKLEQVVECLLDPKTWFHFSISLLTQMPNGGTQAFANLVLTGFGFSNFESTLVGLPASIISFSTILVTGWLATKKRDTSTILISIMAIPPIIGSALMTRTNDQGVKLVGYYLLGFSHGIIPLTMSLIGSNVKGMTKKMTMTALMFMASCAGNIAGPQFFKDSEAPHYPNAFKYIASSYGLACASSIGLRIYLIWVNRRRMDAEGADGFSVNPDTAARTSDIDHTNFTDYNSLGFRYRL